MSEDSNSHLNKLLDRRFDPDKKEAYLSPSFHENDKYGAWTKYLLECTKPIDHSYRKTVFQVTGDLIKKFNSELNHQNLKIDIRYQGAIQSNTHVHLLGDVEILVILTPRSKEKASKSVEKLGTLIMSALSNSSLFDRVDFSNKTNIDLTTKYPQAEVSVLPTVWIDTQSYKESRREIDRGIAEYDFLKRTRRSYLPFRNIARINFKDLQVNGNLKRIIRLVRCIQLDSEEPIHLNHYEIACMLYNLREKKLGISEDYILTLLPKVSLYLEKLVKFDMLKRVISPSRKELVFINEEEKKPELLKLKDEIDMVLGNLSHELRQDGKTIENAFPY